MLREDDHLGVALRRALLRVDGVVMYLFIAVWLLVDLWSGIFVGDSLLLVTPFIFCCGVILVYLTYQSFSGRGIVGGVILVLLKRLAPHRLPNVKTAELPARFTPAGSVGWGKFAWGSPSERMRAPTGSN